MEYAACVACVDVQVMLNVALELTLTGVVSEQLITTAGSSSSSSAGKACVENEMVWSCVLALVPSEHLM